MVCRYLRRPRVMLCPLRGAKVYSIMLGFPPTLYTVGPFATVMGGKPDSIPCGVFCASVTVDVLKSKRFKEFPLTAWDALEKFRCVSISQRARLVQ